MCDSCIIQLNVAYNLKKNAIQSDIKLRQYMIEYGIGVTSYTTCSINTVSVIHPTPMIMSAPSDPNVGSCSISTVTEQRPFPVLPFVIKEEPIDCEAMSDITVENSFDDHLQCNRNGRTSTNAKCEMRNNNSQHQQSLSPLPSNSMVAVNTKSLLLSAREASDNEYLSAYMPAPSSSSSQTTPIKSSKSASTDKQNKTVSKTIETSSTPTKQSNDANKLTKKDTGKEMKKHSKNNKTKGSQKRDITERVTRQNMKMGPDGKGSRETRTRSGSFAKKDYTCFYSMKVTPTDLGKKTKDSKRVNVSIDASNIRTSSAKVSSTKKQRTFSPKTASKKRKLDLKKRSTL